MLDKIVSEIENSRTDKPDPIPAEVVSEWLSTKDLDEMGALYDFLTDKRCVARITPALGANVATEFLEKYFARCFAEDPKSKWADSRYSAAWDLSSMIDALAQEGRRQVEIDRWLRWLRAQYLNGSGLVRQAIETAVLEHVVQRPELRQGLAEWTQHPVLAQALQRSQANVRSPPQRMR